MALRLEDKKAIVDEINVIATGSVSAIAAEYRGLSVSEMTELRKRARSSGIYLRVVRNTLARRAVDGTRFDCMKNALTGPLVFAFAKDDPGAPARLMKEFSKEHDKLKVKVISIDGAMIDASRLSDVATLPTKDQAISQLMSVMIAPVQKLVGTLAAPHTKLVRVLVSVKDQKEASA